MNSRTTNVTSMHTFMHALHKGGHTYAIEYECVPTTELSQTHIHGPCRWPAIITNSIIRNR